MTEYREDFSRAELEQFHLDIFVNEILATLLRAIPGDPSNELQPLSENRCHLLLSKATAGQPSGELVNPTAIYLAQQARDGGAESQSRWKGAIRHFLVPDPVTLPRFHN